MNPYKIHPQIPKSAAAAAADLRLVLAFTDAGHVHGAKVASVFAKARENSRVRKCNLYTNIQAYYYINNSIYIILYTYYNVMLYSYTCKSFGCSFGW